MSNLHWWTKLHEDIFAQRYFCMKEYFCTSRQFCTETFLQGLNFLFLFNIIFFFLFMLVFLICFILLSLLLLILTLGQWLFLVFFFLLIYLVVFFLVFIIYNFFCFFFSTFVQKRPSVQNCNLCKINPLCIFDPFSYTGLPKNFGKFSQGFKISSSFLKLDIFRSIFSLNLS